MDLRNRVLSLANGPLSAKLMFIGEAPGRLGADATQIPFHGDKAGDNFEALISQVGISRYDCFVTNAVLCNPRNDEGNNAPPSKVEIGNCTTFLARQIDLVNPSLIVTLGANSLMSLDMIEKHGVRLAEGVRSMIDWNGRKLIPLYHPGQRAMIHRSFLNQLADYQFVSEALRRMSSGGTKRRSSYKRVDNVVQYCVRALLRRAGNLAYFKLHKLFYLVEYSHFRATGSRLSNAYIIRQKDGPYITDLNAGSLRRSMAGIEMRQCGNELLFRLGEVEADMFSAEGGEQKNPKLDALVQKVWEKYGQATNDQLKAAVYLTSPMRALLRAEKYGRHSTFNQPVEF